MKKRTIKVLIISLLVTSGLIFGYFKIDKFLKVDDCLDHGGRWNYDTNKCESGSDTLGQLKGYNELLGRDDSTTYTISEYNADLPKAENIRRPEKSLIITPTIDTAFLFKIWTLDPDGPHADFRIKKEHFYVVDYDGDGEMPYILKKDSLIVFYNDFIQKGQITKSTMDSLSIIWEGSNKPVHYVEWKN